MSGFLPWGGAFIAAGLAHVAAAAALLLTVTPQDRARTAEPPQSRLDLAVATVERSTAPEVAGSGVEAPRAAADPSVLAAGAVVSATARPVAAMAERAEAVAAAPAPDPPVAADPTSVAADILRPAAARLLSDAGQVVEERPIAVEAAVAVSQPSRPSALVDLRPDRAAVVIAAAVAASPAPVVSERAEGILATAGAAAPPVSGTRVAIAPSPMPAGPVDASSAAGERAAPGQSIPDAVSSAALPATAAPRAPALAMPAMPRTPAPVAAPVLAPESQRATAKIGWSGAIEAVLQTATLDAIEAFVSPSRDTAGEALRDGLRARLSGVECARVQTVFDPETGAVELRGHVPGPEERDLLVAAVEAELRGGLPVSDRLLELPRPQCAVLNGLAATGLAQSTEQFTNPLIIGADAHARVYAFRGGDAMTLDIGGADYGGWLTLAYFDSAGHVVHLVPSAVVPSLWLEPEEAVTFGGGGPRDVTGGGARVIVGPPYGKDIAVALVSSQPIFDAPRAPVEPADAYLADLAQRVAAIRANDPSFKAEWVYLFVATSP